MNDTLKLAQTDTQLKYATLVLFETIVIKLIFPIQHVREPAMELGLPLQLCLVNAHCHVLEFGEKTVPEFALHGSQFF
uniref:Uncharacterized protein n=1 Tax=Anguilla anguilla TaxID=7936 RepID=A0A0E9QSL7_ANGAN